MSASFVSYHPAFPAVDAAPAGYPPAHPNRVLAIGNFDGAHRGHAAVVAAARALGGESAQIMALTFTPHPRAFFAPDTPFFALTQPALLPEALVRIGFEAATLLPFTADLAGLSAQAFITDLLVGRLGVRAVAVGEDFHFGKARAGTPDFLRRAGAQHGFKVALVSPFSAQGGVVSSSRIREALRQGEIVAANTLLGYAYTLEGDVQHGRKLGRELGYPTANLALEVGNGLPYGIYAVWARVDGALYPAIASLGVRPHFDNGAPLLEVHLFDFAGDLYGKILRVGFVAYLRAEQRFASTEALLAQMAQDSAQARAILAQGGLKPL